MSHTYPWPNSELYDLIGQICFAGMVKICFVPYMSNYKLCNSIYQSLYTFEFLSPLAFKIAEHIIAHYMAMGKDSDGCFDNIYSNEW